MHTEKRYPRNERGSALEEQRSAPLWRATARLSFPSTLLGGFQEKVRSFFKKKDRGKREKRNKTHGTEGTDGKRKEWTTMSGLHDEKRERGVHRFYEDIETD